MPPASSITVGVATPNIQGYPSTLEIFDRRTLTCFTLEANATPANSTVTALTPVVDQITAVLYDTIISVQNLQGASLTVILTTAMDWSSMYGLAVVTTQAVSDVQQLLADVLTVLATLLTLIFGLVPGVLAALLAVPGLLTANVFSVIKSLNLSVTYAFFFSGTGTIGL
ncbi:hypothetical protein D9757_000481 [Collybiopsis confluens]|uniref:Uncharacterized protein n=1 Tax=Collybiopsis confluens TaxID=2823264 RepID=A0A8H5I1E5_9AGAR|nr:hypothetical protein D9757_000481 [Collybiopsis confluens]